LVIPAQAGIHLFQWVMDARLRGSDSFRIFCDSIKETEPNENALVPLHPARLFLSTSSMLGAGQRERRKSKSKKPLFSPCLKECAKNLRSAGRVSIETDLPVILMAS
jgi:hypothetical protein